MNQKIKSVWTTDITMPSFPKLEKDESTDVLIIGGGITGILCAYLLKQKGIQYMLCESAQIASGTTAGTTAVVSAQHDILYSDIVKLYGRQRAKGYLHSNLDALKKIKEMCEGIDCDYEERASYIYSETDGEGMKDEVLLLNSLEFPAEFVTQLDLPIRIKGAVKFPAQGQFHPLKFISALCGGLNIYENTQIKKVSKNIAYTDKYQIKAKKIIVASHFPIINTHGFYFAKLYQKRSYVIALQNAQYIDGTYASNEKNGMYFRTYKDLLLVGGGDHRTGKKGGSYDELRKFAKVKFPNATEKFAWATQDCMSLDGIPYIGQYSKRLPNVYTASGFNEWGMTSAMVSAEIITDKISGVKNKYEDVYSPSRAWYLPSLLSNLFVTLLDFITPTTKRCPHLGCALKWNAVEHTWDCPCHGSRFDENGKLLNNPATGDLPNK